MDPSERTIPRPQSSIPRAREEQAAGQSAWRYTGFISHRRLEPDRRWARRLHARLEAYRTPKTLVKAKGVPTAMGPFFLDREELSAGPDLSQAIVEALDRSKWLIVICSPRTPNARWIDAEIAHFVAGNRRHAIIPVLIEGEPDESFPAELRLTEPIAADGRPESGESRRAAEARALLQVSAPILGCRFPDLVQREEARRRRRLQRVLAGVTLGLVFVSALMAYAVIQQNRAERQLALSYGDRGRAELESGSPARAVALLLEASQRGDRSDPTRLALDRALAGVPCAVTRLSGLKGVCARFAAGGRRLVTWSQDRLSIWNSEQGGLVRLLTDGDFEPPCIHVPFDGPLMGACESPRRITLWDPLSGERRGSVDLPYAATSIALDSFGSGLAVGTEDGRLMLGPVGSAPALSVGRLPDAVTAIDFNPDGDLLLAAAASGVAKIVSTNGSRPSVELGLPAGSGILALAPAGDVVARGSTAGGEVRLWGVRDGERSRMDVRKGFLSAIAFSPDGRYVGSAHQDSTAVVWDASTGAHVATLEAHRAPLTALAFSGDGSRLWTTSYDGVVMTWNVDRLPRLAPQVPGQCTGGSLSRDGSLLVTHARDGLEVWSIRERRRLGPRLKPPSPLIGCPQFSGDGRILHSLGTRSHWSWRIGERPDPMATRLPDHVSGVESDRIFPEVDRYVVELDQGFELRALSSGTLVGLRHEIGTVPSRVTLGRTGSALIVAATDDSCRSVNVVDGALGGTIAPGECRQPVVVSPDGRWIGATVARDDDLQIAVYSLAYGTGGRAG